jgi:hypothetical protein
MDENENIYSKEITFLLLDNVATCYSKKMIEKKEKQVVVPMLKYSNERESPKRIY